MTTLGRIVFFVLSVNLGACCQSVMCSAKELVDDIKNCTLDDFIDLDGTELASPDIQELVASIRAELGMKDFFVEVRLTEIETSPAFVAGKHHLFINEDIFRGLNRDEQRGIIGHELIHLRNNHGLKSLLISSSIYSPIGLVLYKVLQDQLHRSKSWAYKFTARLVYFSMFLGFYKCCSIFVHRHYEKEADIVSAQELNTAESRISYFTREDLLEKNYLNSEEYKRKSLFERCKYSFQMFFDPHPSNAKRIAYLQKLMQSKEYQKSL